MRYGDLEWATRTGGRLRGVERVTQLFLAVKADLRLRFRKPEVPGSADAAAALEACELPSSPAVKSVLATVEGLGPPALVGHVLRTYAFGTVLGLQSGLTWDRELFAFSALLHDVALARRRDEHTCFAHDGALQAREVLTGLGVEPTRAHRVAEAVCLHLRVSVPVELGVEAHLVNAGAAVDVVGLRLGELSAEARETILDRYPRADVTAVLQRLLGDEGRRHPDSRAALWLSLGFSRAIAKNPLHRRPRDSERERT